MSLVCLSSGALLVALIMWAASVVGTLSRDLCSAVSWLVDRLTRSASVPVWMLLGVLICAITATMLFGKHRTHA